MSKKAKISVIVAVAVFPLLIVMAVLSSTTKLLKTPNGCTLFLICGAVTNSEKSNASVEVSKNWVAKQFTTVNNPPVGTKEMVPPGKTTSPGDWDGFYAPNNCVTIFNNHPVQPGYWTKIRDIDHPVIRITCP